MIHADFVTQATRENIVVTSERNIGLSQGIVDAFIKAVLLFLDHDTLQYNWMRYLPHDDDCPWEPFWQDVINRIKLRLLRTPVLLPEKKDRPHQPIRISRQLPNSMLDKNWQPLIADISPELHLSQRYQRSDLLLLKDYGLDEMSYFEWVRRVEHDLSLPNSAIKAFLTGDSQRDEDWGTRVAEMLLAADKFLSKIRFWDMVVKHLPMIPLRDERWVSVRSDRPVYYPQANMANPNLNLTIPLLLDLNVVKASVVAKPAWKRLFDHLGLQAAPAEFLRTLILQQHKESLPACKVGDVVEQMVFLYQTHHLATPQDKYDMFKAVCSKRNLRTCSTVDFYIADDNPYGVKLLEGSEPEVAKCHVLHQLYFANVPGLPTEKSEPWEAWLFRHFGVRRHLPITTHGAGEGTSLSEICIYVEREHPEKFVGYLHDAWSHSTFRSSYEDYIYDQLGCLNALCRGGTRVRLKSTYVPLGSLTKLGRPFLKDEFFPWLELEEDFSQYDSFPQSWEPLGKALGLGYRCSPVTFLLDVLCHIAEGSVSAADVKEPERICSLYVRLQSEVRAASSLEEQEKQQQQIR